jgi:hypothetical protein
VTSGLPADTSLGFQQIDYLRQQSQAFVVSKVYEILAVQRRQRQVSGEAAGRDPGVIDRAAPAAVVRMTLEFTLYGRDALAVRKHDSPREKPIYRRATDCAPSTNY